MPTGGSATIILYSAGSLPTGATGFLNPYGVVASFMRYAVIKDASGAILCQTSLVYVDLVNF